MRAHSINWSSYSGAINGLSPRPKPDPSEHKIGIGFAFELTPEGASFPGSMPSGFETSMVAVDPTGTVRVATSVTSPGSGNETGIAQLVADVFGIHPDRFAVIAGRYRHYAVRRGQYQQPKPDVRRRGRGARRARSARADRNLRGNVAAGAPGELSFADGQIVVGGDPERSLPFEKAVATIYTQAYSTALDVELPLQVTRTYRSENVRHTPDEWGRIRSYPSFPYSVHAAVVEVDTTSGCVKLLDYAAVHDCGMVVNPGLVEGQFKGAVAMGIGAALWEELLHDDQGRTMTSRFKSYVLPRATDLPNFASGIAARQAPSIRSASKEPASSGWAARWPQC